MRSQVARDVSAVGAAYVIGSVPFGLLLGRLTRGLDVRDTGSGSMGTTNVLRAVGPGAAAATFGLDVAKGSGAVVLARRVHAGEGAQVAAGLAAMVGHSWPVFAGFRGGKSVATAFGGLLTMSEEASMWAVAGGLCALGATRTVSVGSLSAAAAATVGAGLRTLRGHRAAPLVYVGLAGALISVRHQDNIRRLVHGGEPRLRFRRRRSPPASV